MPRLVAGSTRQEILKQRNGFWKIGDESYMGPPMMRSTQIQREIFVT